MKTIFKANVHISMITNASDVDNFYLEGLFNWQKNEFKTKGGYKNSPQYKIKN